MLGFIFGAETVLPTMIKQNINAYRAIGLFQPTGILGNVAAADLDIVANSIGG
jgi:hypothetical protein